MLTDECNLIYDKLVKSLKDYKGIIRIENLSYYIYLFNRESKMVAIVHGYGTATEPYNVKFMTKSRRERDFYTIEQFTKYLSNEFISDLTASFL